ncbi:MAG: ABC transporter permease [Armatimonadetes bacterium]|nr:ABC transporter permease [Armatimonadota bacterium]
MELVASAIRLTVPILLASLGAVFSERGGVVNIGLEGIMIVGTFFGALGALKYGPAAGVAMAAAAGLALALLHAVVTITFHVDQIISGVALNMLAGGLTRFLSILLFGMATQSPGVPGFAPLSVPLLRDVPFLRPVASGISPLVVLAALAVVAAHLILTRTVFGLRLRAVGENPHAADTLGLNVYVLRYSGVLLSGVFAGVAGSYLAIEQGRHYFEGMTQGRGFIALAALIFGNWWPVGAAAASALFGFFDALSLRVVVTGVPYQFITALPYAVSILVLAGVVRRARPPAAAGRPYVKEEG